MGIFYCFNWWFTLIWLIWLLILFFSFFFSFFLMFCTYPPAELVFVSDSQFHSQINRRWMVNHKGLTIGKERGGERGIQFFVSSKNRKCNIWILLSLIWSFFSSLASVMDLFIDFYGYFSVTFLLWGLNSKIPYCFKK